MIRIHKLVEDPELFAMVYPVGCNIQYNLEKIRTMAKHLNDHYKGDYVNLWCRGSSGAIIAGVLCSLYCKPQNIKIAHVKKPGELSHCSTPSTFSFGSNVFVDDFVGSGATMRATLEDCESLDGILVTGDLKRSTVYEVLTSLDLVTPLSLVLCESFCGTAIPENDFEISPQLEVELTS